MKMEIVLINPFNDKKIFVADEVIVDNTVVRCVGIWQGTLGQKRKLIVPLSNIIYMEDFEFDSQKLMPETDNIGRISAFDKQSFDDVRQRFANGVGPKSSVSVSNNKEVIDRMREEAKRKIQSKVNDSNMHMLNKPTEKPQDIISVKAEKEDKENG